MLCVFVECKIIKELLILRCAKTCWYFENAKSYRYFFPVASLEWLYYLVTDFAPATQLLVFFSVQS
ncbi:Pre-mRNA-processing protein 40A [Zea mays]|uniref:Pre-mRNA-processing protein 40A n=1 Tax=Zea mays TaxID=4577 RepID=A0A1D6NNM7_MAIZE|nr:Pre-mRNA-processing protein 40A [Zea mays]